MGEPRCPSCKRPMGVTTFKGETHAWCENRACMFYSERYEYLGLELVFRRIEADCPLSYDTEDS